MFYNETVHNKFIPRAILGDADKYTADLNRSGTFGKLFEPDNIIGGTTTAGNNWAKGMYTEGAEIAESILNCARKEVERCEYFEGFQLVHALGGGTGSGLACHLLQKLRDEYPGRMICTYSIVPSVKVSDTVVEPYNTILTLPYLINYADEVFVIDNEALHDICYNNLKLMNATHADFNFLTSRAMAGITTFFRLPGDMNGSLREIKSNMVPYPHLHFLMPAFVPMATRDMLPLQKNSLKQCVSDAYNVNSLMCKCDPNNGKYLTKYCTFRGEISRRDLDLLVDKMNEDQEDYLVEYIPNNIKASICNIPMKGFKFAAAFIGNNTAICEVWDRIYEPYCAMLERQWYLNWYYCEGLEEEEFFAAQRSAISLFKRYRSCEGVYCDTDTEDDLIMVEE